MKQLPLQGRTLALIAIVVPLFAIFIYVGIGTGPFAPVAVIVATVESRAITPALFGIGTVEARFTYKIGPTTAGRVKRLDVHVGGQVKAGQILGEMDPVDLDERLRSLESRLRRVEAEWRGADARRTYAETQAHRYEQMFEMHSTTEEIYTTKRQELQIAEAALFATQEELGGARADRDALEAQLSNLRLIAPIDGTVTVRDADPGTTIIAGQQVVEVIDTKSLWINVRFDQISSSGLVGGLPAHIVLRSRRGLTSKGKVLRVELKADAVTEETLAKIVYDVIPQPIPPLGEVAEVTVELAPLPDVTSIPYAAVRNHEGQIGVWQIVDGEPRFTPTELGMSDLDGFVQVLDGLNNGDEIVVYSDKPLTTNSRIREVDNIQGRGR